MESATARLPLTPRALLERSRLSALLRYLGRGGGLTAFGVYLVLALIWGRAALAHLGSACACTTYGDAAQFPWTFVWFPHALFHGLNLLHTPVIWSPGGRNLAGATAPLLPAFAVAPVTYLWGPFVGYNLVAILAPVTAAWSAYCSSRPFSGYSGTASLCWASRQSGFRSRCLIRSPALTMRCQAVWGSTWPSFAPSSLLCGSRNLSKDGCCDGPWDFSQCCSCCPISCMRRR